MTIAAEPTSTLSFSPETPGVTRPMTYEEYLAEPEEMARYDIIDGYKEYRLYGEKQVASPTLEHQDIVLNLGGLFRAFQKQTGAAHVVIAPCDVLITRTPRLRARQPDVLLISPTRFEGHDRYVAEPLSPAPELVVEIVSPSDKPGVLAAKIADYRSVGVEEVWLVRAEPQTVEVVRLTEEEIETVAHYELGQTVQSVVFPGLSVAVSDIFAQ